MEVLLTGNTGYLTEEFISKVFPDCSILISGDTNIQSGNRKKIKVLPIMEKGEEKEIFSAYEFERIIYFSQYLTFHGSYEGELEHLRMILQYCRRGKNVQMVYLTGPEGNYNVSTGKTVLVEAAEQLCMHYNEVNQLPVKIIRIPYLYSASYKKDYFYKLFQKIEQKEEIVLTECACQKMYFICMEDLAELLYRVFDNWDTKREILSVADEFGNTFGDFVSLLKTQCPAVNVRLLEEAVVQELQVTDRVLRKRYGWFPKVSLFWDVPYLLQEYNRIPKHRMKTRDKLKRWLAVHKKIWGMIELIFGFGVMELLNYLTGNHVQFRMIDCRLLFIVVYGTIYGMNLGMGAACLASFSLVRAYVKQGMNGFTLFYEPTNWVPFIVYFTAGAVCGYVQLKNKEFLRFVQKENTLLKKKNLFIKSLYQDALQGKRELRKQIIGSRDSFGKIFDITKQLNSVYPQEICMRAIQVLEEGMENDSVAVYLFGKGEQSAKLEAASQSIFREIPREWNPEDYKDAMEVLEKKELWVNRKMDVNAPMYMAGIHKDSKLVLVIIIYRMKYEQMNLYYENLLHILSGLIEMFFVRAVDYQELVARLEEEQL